MRNMRWKKILKSNEHVDRMADALLGLTSELPYEVLEDYLKSYPNLSIVINYSRRPPLFFKHTKHAIEIGDGLNLNRTSMVESAVAQEADYKVPGTVYHGNEERDSVEKQAANFFAGIRALDFFMGAVPPNTIKGSSRYPFMEFIVGDAEIRVDLTKNCSNRAYYDSGIEVSMCIRDAEEQYGEVPAPDKWLTYYLGYSNAEDMDAEDIINTDDLPTVIGYAARGTAELTCAACAADKVYSLDSLYSVECENCGATLVGDEIDLGFAEDYEPSATIYPSETDCPYGHKVEYENDRFSCDKHGLRILNAKDREYDIEEEGIRIGEYRILNGLILDDRDYEELELNPDNLRERFDIDEIMENAPEYEEMAREAYGYERVEEYPDNYLYYSAEEDKFFYEGEVYDFNPILDDSVLGEFYDIAAEYSIDIPEMEGLVSNETIRAYIAEEMDRVAEITNDETKPEVERLAMNNYYNELNELIKKLS